MTSATPGGSITYTIVANNSGPSDDPTVTLTDIIPSQLNCDYSSVASAGALGNTTSGTGNLSETLNMPNGSSVTYTLNCVINSSATGTLSNTVTLVSSVIDPDSANNSATDN